MSEAPSCTVCDHTRKGKFSPFSLEHDDGAGRTRLEAEPEAQREALPGDAERPVEPVLVADVTLARREEADVPVQILRCVREENEC